MKKLRRWTFWSAVLIVSAVAQNVRGMDTIIDPFKLFSALTKIYNDLMGPTLDDHLWHAVLQGNLHEMRSLIARGANIQIKDALDNATLLHHAIIKHQTEAARFLFENGADQGAVTKAHGRNVLHLAVIDNNLDLVKYFIEYGSDMDVNDLEGLSPFAMAVNYGHKSIKRIMSDVKNYYAWRSINRRPVFSINCGLLAIRPFNPCDMSLLLNDTSVDLLNYSKVRQWQKSDESALRELFWLHCAKTNTTPEKICSSLMPMEQGRKVLTHYRLFYKMQRQEKCIDSRFFFS